MLQVIWPYYTPATPGRTIKRPAAKVLNPFFDNRKRRPRPGEADTSPGTLATVRIKAPADRRPHRSEPHAGATPLHNSREDFSGPIRHQEYRRDLGQGPKPPDRQNYPGGHCNFERMSPRFKDYWTTHQTRRGAQRHATRYVRNHSRPGDGPGSLG